VKVALTEKCGIFTLLSLASRLYEKSLIETVLCLP